MRSSRALAAIALAVTTATVAAACSSGSSTSSTSTSASSGSTAGSAHVTLTWWNNANIQPLLGVFQNVIKTFEASHPGITIQNVPMQNELFKTKISPALRGSSPPDIFQQWGSGQQATQVQSGKLADISSYVSPWISSLGTPATAWQTSGKWYGVPYDLHVVGFWYRKDLFAKAGITSPPATVPELESDDAKLRAHGITPIALGSKDGWPDAFWFEYFAIRECSESTVRQAMSSVSLSAPCFTKASADLNAFVKTNPFQTAFLATPAQSVPNSSVGLLANGKAAMELQGDWEPGAGAGLTSDKNFFSKLGWFPFPAVPGGAGDPKAVLGGGDGYSCTTAAAEPACAEFLRYLTTTAVQRQIVGAGTGLPANPAAADALTVPAEKDAAAANSAAPYVAVYFDIALPTTPGQNLDNAVAKWFASPDSTGSGIISSVTGPGAVRRGGGDRRRRKLRKGTELTILLGPGLVLFLGFVLAPIVIGAYYSLFNWDGYGPLTNFTGLHNYKIAFSDPVFVQAIEHTLILTGLSLVIQGPLSVAIALLLNRKFRGRALMRLVVFAPYVLPPAVTAVMWSLLLQPGGLVDQVMKAVGLGGLVQLWLANVHVVLYTVFGVLTWQYLGFGIILLLAGLQGIPVELREAAAIDGANPWQSTWRITLPLLGPTMRIWGFITVIGSLQVFDVIWLMTEGGPANASDSMATYMYRTGFQNQAFSYGTAIAIIMFLFCFIFSLVYQRYALRRDTAGALTRAVG